MKIYNFKINGKTLRKLYDMKEWQKSLSRKLRNEVTTQERLRGKKKNKTILEMKTKVRGPKECINMIDNKRNIKRKWKTN